MGYMKAGQIVGWRKCRVCGKKFNPSSPGHWYCSVKCMRRRYDKWDERVGMRIQCANARCGRTFTIGDRNDGKVDKRTRFCCAACEKQHWRDVTRHKNPEQTTHLQQFHSAEEYASYERRTNEQT